LRELAQVPQLEKNPKFFKFFSGASVRDRIE
jgi:hypothetical protein